MIAVGSHRVRLALIIAIAAVALGIASTASLAAFGPFAGSRSCAAPALSGTVVDVTLTDMGGMMGPGMMGNGSYGSGANNNGYPWPPRGTTRVFVNPSTVPAGQVSLRVRNKGALTHEVVVLPLPQGQLPGQRVSGPDGKVDETGSLGEASRTCGAGEGMNIAPYGIAAGASGWTTITLPPGRYELICNIAGHYWAGMYTELDVSGPSR